MILQIIELGKVLIESVYMPPIDLKSPFWPKIMKNMKAIL